LSIERRAIPAKETKMGSTTKIITADHTWNPWIGCNPISAGCAHCYAETMNKRWKWIPDFAVVTRTKTTWKNPPRWQKEAEAEGRVGMVFCASLSDFFHPAADQWRAEAWGVIKNTPNLIWRLTTKMPQLVADRLPPDWGTGYPNVWLGVTVEMRKYLWRLDAIKKVPAAAHYLAAEPLLEDLMPDLAEHISGVDWAVLGGETGNGHRVMDAQWARNVRDLCNERGIAFWFLGHGGTHQKDTLLDGVEHTAYPALLDAYRARPDPQEEKQA
jgi:protein gp37